MTTTNHRTVIIFDTEYTSWEGSLQRGWSEPWEHRELVQIAAVRTVETAAGFEAVDTLDLVVQPQVNREVSDYFVALTGLDRERIAVEGVSFQTA
ncbi:MAG: exonuclease domain-containing protein, partial [Lentisphaeria bacterium]|nr:exonuclease domain-containing protein [Lentisphaeria bacterium]